MKFRNAYERIEHKGIEIKGNSLTQQHFKDDCDTNKIIERYTRTGVVPADLVQKSAGVYGDFSNVGDFLTAQQSVAKARESFEALPSAVRRRFNDDPAQFIDFMSNGNNYEEALKLGLVNKRVVLADPDKVVVSGDSGVTDVANDVKA